MVIAVINRQWVQVSAANGHWLWINKVLMVFNSFHSFDVQASGDVTAFVLITYSILLTEPA